VFTEQLTQSLAVMGQLPSSNHASNTDASVAGIDMSNLRRLITYLDVGVIAAGGTLQLFYKSSANANMAGSTNLGNAATPSILNCNTSNRVESLEIRADQLPAGHRYVQPVLITGTATANVGMIVLGGESAYRPASQFGTANVLDQGVVT
jgi:hypothetical protein